MPVNVGGVGRGYLRSDTELRLDAELGGPTDQLRLRADAELAIDIDEVAFHRALAQVQVARDLGRGLAAGSELRNLAFAAAESVDTNGGLAPWAALAPGQEDLDLIGNRVDVTEPRPVVGPRQLHVFGRWEVLREITGVPDVYPGVTGAVQNQRRLDDRRQQVANVHPHVHANDVLRHGRARRCAKVPGPP